MRLIPYGFYDIADENGVGGSGRAYSDRTYNLEKLSHGGVGSYIRGRDAVRQAVVKILHTERFRYPIYTDDYGVELQDLFGMDCDYVSVELKRRISEALLADDRIERVTDFGFVTGRNVVYVSFTVHSVYDEYRVEDFAFAITGGFN